MNKLVLLAMDLEEPTNENIKSVDRIKTLINNPKYSIFSILGFPFILALIWAIFDPYALPLVLVGPLVLLAYYAYYTGNKISSAIMGLFIFPLTLFYVDPIGAIIDLRFEHLFRYIEWSYIFEIINDFWKYSLAHFFIGFFIAFRKTPYLLIAVLIFVLQLIELLSHID